MSAKLDRCVADVKAKGEDVNPWAVCNASINEDHQEAVSIPNDLSAMEKPTKENILKTILETKFNEKVGCGCQKNKITS